MTFKEKKINEVMVLTIKWNLMGGSDTQELRDRIDELLDENVSEIVFDLGKVKWINSVGLGTLIACYTSVVNKNGSIRLARLTKKVKSIMIISQIIKVFKNYETVDEAVKSFDEELVEEDMTV